MLVFVNAPSRTKVPSSAVLYQTPRDYRQLGVSPRPIFFSPRDDGPSCPVFFCAKRSTCLLMLCWRDFFFFSSFMTAAAACFEFPLRLFFDDHAHSMGFLRRSSPFSLFFFSLETLALAYRGPCVTGCASVLLGYPETSLSYSPIGYPSFVYMLSFLFFIIHIRPRCFPRSKIYRRPFFSWSHVLSP